MSNKRENFSQDVGLIESFKSLFSSVFQEERIALRQLIREELEKKKDSLEREERFMSRVQAGKRLGCSLPTIDRHIQDGNLKARKRGGRVFIAESEIIRFAVD